MTFVRKHDEYVATCSCGWLAKRVMFADSVAARAARQHVNRTRTPRHRAVAVNVTKLEVVGTYSKDAFEAAPSLFDDRPPF